MKKELININHHCLNYFNLNGKRNKKTNHTIPDSDTHADLAMAATNNTLETHVGELEANAQKVIKKYESELSLSKTLSLLGKLVLLLVTINFFSC